MENWVYFFSYRSGPSEVWKTHLETQRTVQVTTTGGVHAIESLDGKTLYFSKQEDGEGIWEQPVAGGASRRVVPHLKHRSLFTVQKSGIFYVERPRGTKEDVLYFWRFSDQKTLALHTFEKEFRFGLDVSSDERTVFFSQYDVNNADVMLIDEFR